MRHLLIGSLTVFLVGCNSVAPSGLKISLNSDKVLSVSRFEFEPGDELSGCSVSGTIEYDIKIEPENYTGIIDFNGLVLEYAGKWRSEPDSQLLTYLDGKLIKNSGINIYASASSDDPKDKKEALCASKSSSDIKVVSLGDPVIAYPGIKVALPNKKVGSS